MKGERRKLALPKLFSNFQNLSFFKVRAHFFWQKFQKISKFSIYHEKTFTFLEFSKYLSSTTGTFFRQKFWKISKFSIFHEKTSLCELFLNFQNLKLSIMMFSPSSKQNQRRIH